MKASPGKGSCFQKRFFFSFPPDVHLFLVKKKQIRKKRGNKKEQGTFPKQGFLTRERAKNRKAYCTAVGSIPLLWEQKIRTIRKFRAKHYSILTTLRSIRYVCNGIKSKTKLIRTRYSLDTFMVGWVVLQVRTL